jgi:hypothetical protein
MRLDPRWESGFTTKRFCSRSSHLKKSVEDAIKKGLDKDSGMPYHIATIGAGAPNPGLDVEGVGLIGLPLVDSSAKALIAACSQAPFGKGERTLVDKDVRDTWEVDAEKVRIVSLAWNECL